MTKKEDKAISFDGNGVCATPEADSLAATKKAATTNRGLASVANAEQFRRRFYFELQAGRPLGPAIFARKKK